LVIAVLLPVELSRAGSSGLHAGCLRQQFLKQAAQLGSELGRKRRRRQRFLE
jgi:hypothetical protein